MTAQSEKLIQDLRSENSDIRYAAWVAAANANPEIIPALGKLLTSDQPGVRKAADEALKKIVHSVGKDTGNARRTPVVNGLIGLTDPAYSTWVRTVALRHLSAIGGDASVAPVAKLLRDPELQEEAAFCLERIPGGASDRALMAAFADVKDEFKPRILAALGHRRTAAAAQMVAAAVGSPNLDIAMAALKASGRIGQSPGKAPKGPDYKSLTPFQQVEYADSILRYADAMAPQGKQDEAIGLYQRALDAPEEHLQCAAIVGLAKMRSPKAAALIEPKLKSENRNVRITAGKVRA
jgi:HEAT repeat protein